MFSFQVHVNLNETASPSKKTEHYQLATFGNRLVLKICAVERQVTFNFSNQVVIRSCNPVYNYTYLEANPIEFNRLLPSQNAMKPWNRYQAPYLKKKKSQE